MANAIADHWAKDDVYSLIVAALENASKPLDNLTVDDLAPVDHFHARGFPATRIWRISCRSRPARKSSTSDAGWAAPPAISPGGSTAG